MTAGVAAPRRVALVTGGTGGIGRETAQSSRTTRTPRRACVVAAGVDCR